MLSEDKTVIFDEAGSIPASLRMELVYHGMIFQTALYDEELEDYGTVIAKNFVQAQIRVEERGLGEIVQGQVKQL